jgi:hypothetical protein
VTQFSEQYAEYIKKVQKETKYGQAVPYEVKRPDQKEVVGFWKDAQEKLAQGWRFEFANRWQDRQMQPAEWRNVRLPTSTDMWKEGREGAWTPGATGTYDEMTKELELERHPGAVDILDSGVPYYGGKNETEERFLRARAALKYGARYIEDMNLDFTFEQQQEYQTSNEAQRIAMVTKALKGKQTDMAKAQDERSTHKAYEWIFENFGKYYHQGRQLGTDLMEAGLANAYLDFSGDESYRKAWADADAKMEQDFLYRKLYNPVTQAVGAQMFADVAENLFWQALPWNWGEKDTIKAWDNIPATLDFLRDHPGITEPEAKHQFMDDYWSTMADEWLNPFELVTDKAIEIIFPVTIAPLAAKGLAKFFPKIARKATQVTPELAKFFKTADEGTINKFLGGLDRKTFDNLQETGFIKAWMDDVKGTSKALDEWADDWGIFSNTAEAKSHRTHQEAKYGIRWLLGNLGHKAPPEQVYETLQVIAKLASDDITEVSMAWREISKMPNADYWFSASGQEAATVFNRAISAMDGEEKKIEKLYETLKKLDTQSEKTATFLAFVDDTARKYTDEMFPTLETILKQGGKRAEELPEHLKAAGKFHKKAQKVYGPVTQWFSDWYLGRTPGYFVRNGLQNFSQTIYDLGFKSVGGATVIDDAFNWAGLDELLDAGEDVAGAMGELFVGMNRGLGGLEGGLGTKVKIKPPGERKPPTWRDLLDARWWSSRVEQFGGKTITGHLFPKEMKRLLRGNLSKQFMTFAADKGIALDAKTANFFEDAIMMHNGNMNKARKYVEDQVRSGFWKDAQFRNLSLDLQQKSQNFRLEENIYQWLSESENAEDFGRKVDDFIEEMIDSAEEAIRKEGAPSPPRGASQNPGHVANAVTFDGLPQDISNAYNSTRAANIRTNEFTWSAWQTTREEIVTALVNTGKYSDQEARLLVVKWADEVKLVPEGQFAESVGQLTGADVIEKRLFSPDVDIGNKRLYQQQKAHGDRYAKRKEDIAKLTDEGDLNKNLKKYWDDNFAKDFGEYTGQNLYDVKRANHRLFLLEDRGFWNEWTNTNYDFIRRTAEGVVGKAVAETGQLGERIPPIERMFSKAHNSLQEGLKYQRWVPQSYIEYELSYARTLKDESRKLWTFATEYAKQYGIESVFMKDGMEFVNHKRLVSILNKQLGTDFPHLGKMTGLKESQVRDAFRAYSLDRYLRIVDDPEAAIDLVLKVIQPGEFSNKNILERLTSDQLKDLKRFNFLIESADEDIAHRFRQAIQVRKKIADPATAANADAYNDLVAKREEADKVLSQVGEEVLDLLGARKQDITAKTLEPFVEMSRRSPEQFVSALEKMDSDDAMFLYNWLRVDNPELAEDFKKMQMNMASMGTAGEEQLEDLWKFVDEKVPEDIAEKLRPYGKTFMEEHNAIIAGKRPYGFYGGEFGPSPQDVPYGVKIRRGALEYKGEKIDLTYKTGRHSTTLDRDILRIQEQLDRIGEIDDALLEGIELGKVFGYDEENIDAWAQAFKQIELEYQGKLDKLDAQRKAIYKTAGDVSKYIEKKYLAGTSWVGNAIEEPVAHINDFTHLWSGEDARTVAGQIYDSKDELRKYAVDLKSQMKANWNKGTKVDATDSKRILDQWNEIENTGKGMVSSARMGAMRSVQEQRDFILHDYENRYNFDTVLAYLYPYHFWHTRNTAKWVKRIAQKPGVARNYARFLERLERINADQPEWFRHNVRVTGVLGYTDDNPLLLNLDALLNPTYQALKVFDPFIDQNKRDTAFSRLLDDSGRMMSVHSLIPIMYGFFRYAQGDKEQGAAWMSRLIPQTKVVSAATSVVANKLNIDAWRRGVELDPILGLQGVLESGGDWSEYFTAFDPYEQKRVAIAYEILVQSGEYTKEEIIDAIMSEDSKHPVNVAAHGIAQSKKNTGDLLSFLGGPSMQIRNEDERRILAIDQEFRALFEGVDYLDEHETAQMWDYMRNKYPQYFDTMMLTRKNRDDRERSFVYNVMGRIPPGAGGTAYEAVGIDYADVQDFYDSKGDSLEKMSEPDRLKFMAGIYEISTVAAFPDQATANEWREVKRRYGLMSDELHTRYGDETYAAKDLYFQLLKEDPEQAYMFLDANPKLGYLMSDETQWQWQDPLMTKYYASFGNGRSMLRAEMYDRLDAQFPNGREMNDAYWAAKAAGEKVKPSDELKEYWDQKSALESLYGMKIVEWGTHLPDGPVDFPKRFDPNEPPPDASRGTIALAQTELDKAEVPAQYGWTWEQWEQVMDPTTARLAQDWAFRGAELPQALKDDLEYMLEGMGSDIDINQALYLMQQASHVAGAQYYGPDNPPWWMTEGGQ